MTEQSKTMVDQSTAADEAMAPEPTRALAGAIPHATPHSLFEDVYALIVGTLLLSLGVVILQRAQLATGGVAGLALTLRYITGIPVGLLYAALTLPMLAITIRAMGHGFLIKTLIVTFGVFALTALAPHVFQIAQISRPAAAIVGGTVIGMGALALARHAAGSGGSGAIVLWLYRTRGWNAGRTQMTFDACVLLFSLISLDLEQMLWSLLGVAATGGILYVWHRPGRYTGY
ncbi:YitT family protein [Novosphingobium sp. 1949]|uniref:YitT family protein n=1 Tax=Novosphingobium organovorum TaxID=2930092 RepID=A0ABT0BDZ0_9SPHN|nr:YitT family protein [Novosphingobium organovorum]MCJ2183203.1 YitT family protein [Novosphingobium organovorum]